MPEEAPTTKRTHVEIADVLGQEKGLPALQRRVDEFVGRSSADPVAAMEELMEVYRVWAVEMKPGMAFEQILAQLYHLGTNEQVYVGPATD